MRRPPRPFHPGLRRGRHRLLHPTVVMKLNTNPRARRFRLTPTFAVLVLSSFLIHPAQAAPWVTNGPLKLGRFAHTSTLLLNGQVLIVGGVVTAGANANSVE